MLYSALQKILFRFNPETAHHLGMLGMAMAKTAHLSGLLAGKVPDSPVEVMGLKFRNAVGLAAGLDKDGDYIDALAAFGFGAIEVGTVTPRPQPGNPKPRLFRLPEYQAIINRMGFNNRGVDYLIEQVRKSSFQKNGGILGINIGKNATTPIEQAAEDYLICLDKVYNDSSYVAINISSPNTKNLRELQKDDALDDLLGRLKARQTELAARHGRYVPLALKIAPDLDDTQITAIADALRRHRMDAVIATNTTLGRQGIENSPYASETGGLSGAPVFEKSTAVLKQLAEKLAGEVPIIGVGGILSGADAVAKIEAGAKLVQIYSGYIFRGPELVGEIARTLAAVPAIKG
ncbi:MAG: dihydroorotate oxidase [Proteobacteria bacterium]|nr:dihydroorotate oxidase [Pseudomonadota bacterium]